MSFFLQSAAAGLSIALGGYAYLSVESRYLGAFLFSFGLYAVCQYQIPLFTGRIAYLGRPGGYKPHKLLLMLLYNFIGAGLVGLLFLPMSGGADVLSLVNKKLSYLPYESFIRGLFCGMIVFVGVDIFRRFEDPLGRYLGVLIGVPAFILAGFEHCVADAFYLAAAWKLGLPLSMSGLVFMLMVILGNTLGALLMNLLISQPQAKEKPAPISLHNTASTAVPYQNPAKKQA